MGLKDKLNEVVSFPSSLPEVVELLSAALPSLSAPSHLGSGDGGDQVT